jgi:hypothetical protein
VTGVNVHSNAKPGGCVEFQDWDTEIYSADGSLTKEHSLYMYHEHVRAAQRGDTTPGPAQKSKGGFGMLASSTSMPTNFLSLSDRGPRIRNS